ncbi:MAG: WYL domain-containing protein [Verrucomicrobiae bacterium]|nr:WYL domain-containing protein [Verrucomicrobiae bacterium]
MVRPAGFSSGKHFAESFGVFTGGKSHEVRIRFDSFAAHLVRERKWHASQKIKELAADGIELTLRLNNLHEVERWILSWGEHARVVAPEILRRDIVNTLKAMMGRY